MKRDFNKNSHKSTDLFLHNNTMRIMSELCGLRNYYN